VTSATVANVVNQIETDSYDGLTYATSTPKDNGDLFVTGKFAPGNGMTIEGDLRAEEGVEATGIDNQIVVKGQTILGDNPDAQLNFVGGKPEFHETFSTKDEVLFEDGAQPTFEGDVIIDGSLDQTGNPDVDVDDPSSGTANVYVDGDADINKKTYIEGDLIVDGDIEFEGDPTVEGDVIASGTISGNVQNANSVQQNSGSTVDSMLRDPLNPTIPTYPVANVDENEWPVSETDNNDIGAIDVTGTLQGCSSTCTLPAGRYRLENIDLSGSEILALDTTGGPVEIYVEDYVDLQDQAKITTIGDNDVKIYVGGGASVGSNVHFRMTNQAAVRAGEDGTQITVFLEPSKSVLFNSGGVFQGVLYGAGGTGQGATIEVSNQLVVYGAIIGKMADIDNQVTLHYDEDLDSIDLFAGRDGNEGRVAYLWTTQRTVTVD
jgi:hypothetical protein